MIQVLTNNKKYAGNGIVINSISKPRSLDEFEVNIIDLNDDIIWQNRDMSKKSINGIRNFMNISTMISYSKKMKILILLPQDIRFCYYQRLGEYEYVTHLKNMLPELRDILLSLCSSFQSINLVYENTSTKIEYHMLDVAFFFTRVSGEKILLNSVESQKPTAVILNEKTIAATLQISEYSEMVELLTALNLIQVKQNTPSWLAEVRMFDDNKQFEIIEENNQRIRIANDNISTARERINKNMEYKSILYTNGDELVRVVFEILEMMLGCDLSQFVDKKAKDFLFEIEDTVFIGEIKGVNHNVKSENVSQLDVHYQGYLEEHPDKDQRQIKAILIMNHQKNKPLGSREPVHERQIQLACRNGSLIIETITLLKLFEQYLAEALTREDCLNLLSTQTGILAI